MKTASIAGVLCIFSGLFVACGAKVEGEPKKDPPVTIVTNDGGPGPDPDGGADVVEPPATCGASVADPACKTLSPAPTDEKAISKFVKDVAIPLRCSNAGSKAAWDLRPLVDLYGDKRMFMIGEVHGTNEIGIVSSLLLDELASKKLVNVVGFEIPMDWEAPLQRWVDTGKDPQAEQLLHYFSTNMFGSILTKTARGQVQKGNPLTIAAVDIPQDPQFAAQAIRDVASKLVAQKDNVLATLPSGSSQPPTASDITSVKTYFDHITSQKTQICAELSENDCDKLVAMTHALWASTLAYDESEGQSQLWFERREVAIYFNMKSKIATASDRMFLHMGAAHTNKFEFSSGSRMSKEYALTKGRTFSIAPAYGDGSVIWYGKDEDLPGEPTTLTTALSNKPANPFFVSTTRPSASCVANPFGAETEDTVGVGGKRSDLYDGYIHYGTLTSEKRPFDATLSRDDVAHDGKGAKDLLGPVGLAESPALRAFADFRANVARRENEALEARQR